MDRGDTQISRGESQVLLFRASTLGCYLNITITTVRFKLDSTNQHIPPGKCFDMNERLFPGLKPVVYNV